MRSSPLARVQENTVTSHSSLASVKKTSPLDHLDEVSELTSPGAEHTRGSQPSSTSCVTPPDLRVILAFMVRYSATSSASANNLPLPFSFTGCDYALVLHACFPNKCIDLSSLSWSSAPLQSQLTGNLECFCAAARALGLVETPFSALHAHLLQPTASNVLHHLQVQHWLYVMSRRFPPNPSYDALAMRVFLRHQQLGIPTLKRTRSELEGGGGGVVVTVENAADGLCASVQQLAPLTTADLARCMPYVCEVPPFTESPSRADHEDEQRQAGKPKPSTSTTTSASRGPSPSSTGSNRPKPWLSYSKPWRLPALEAAKAKKEAEAAAAAKRREARQARDPSRSAFAESSSSLYDQYEVSRDTAQRLQRQLREVHTAQVANLVRTGSIDFAEALAALEKAGIIPPTPRSTE